MPLYYFDTDLGGHFVRDDEGTELVDEHAALEDGATAMTEVAKNYLPGSPRTNITIFVRTGPGEALFDIALKMALPLRSDGYD